MRGYLEKIVNHPSGIIFKSRIIRKPFQMEGKTGIIQALRIIQEQRAQVMTKTNSNCYGNTEIYLFSESYQRKCANALLASAIL